MAQLQGARTGLGQRQLVALAGLAFAASALGGILGGAIGSGGLAIVGPRAEAVSDGDAAALESARRWEAYTRQVGGGYPDPALESANDWEAYTRLTGGGYPDAVLQSAIDWERRERQMLGER